MSGTDIAYEVGLQLQSSGFGTLGVDIFIGQIPPDKQGLYVMRSGGTPNKYVPIEETVVGIYSKNVQSSTAISALETIKRHFNRMHSTETVNSYIYTYLVIGDVEDVQRDAEYDKIYKITVQVLHRDKALIS